MPWPEAGDDGPPNPVFDYIGQHYGLAAGVLALTAVGFACWRPVRPRGIALKRHFVLSIKIYAALVLPFLVGVWLFFFDGHPAGLAMQLIAGIALMPFMLPFIALFTMGLGQLLH